MKFNRQPPPAHLSHLIQYFWTLEGDTSHQSPQRFGPLADGFPGLVFQPLEHGSFHDEDGKRLAEIFLYGQTLTRTAIYMIGKFRTIGVSFQPDALKTVFGFNAIELTDSCMDVDLLRIAREHQLSDKLLGAASSASRIEILSRFILLSASKQQVKPDVITQLATGEIIRSGGQISLPALHVKYDITERTFERRFNQNIGITPKLFSRVVRFQASLQQLKLNQYARLSDIAFDNGYTDQAHFIRSFKEFAGISPAQFLQSGM